MDRGFIKNTIRKMILDEVSPKNNDRFEIDIPTRTTFCAFYQKIFYFSHAGPLHTNVHQSRLRPIAKVI